MTASRRFPVPAPASRLLLPLAILLTGIDQCQSGTDSDGDGYTSAQGDCDDSDPEVHPGAPERCNGVDDDCDGSTDDGFGQTWYLDGDGDHYGDAAETAVACARPAGYVPDPGDCDDDLPAISPLAFEVCDGIDNDCDGRTDGDDPSASGAEFRPDVDGDGFGADDAEPVLCDRPAGWAAARGDCDDADSAAHPGADDPGGDLLDGDCGGSDAADPHVGLGAGSLSSIQAALDAAVPGQTVWVGPGIYLEHALTMRGKAVALRATRGAGETFVDASWAGTVFRFVDGEDNDSLLEGFTLRRGQVNPSCSRTDPDCGLGAGVYMAGAAPTLHANVIQECRAGYGGGLYLLESTPVLRENRIVGNDATHSGGGIMAIDSELTLTSDVLSANTSGLIGGGLYVEDSSITVIDATISRNRSEFAAGAFLDAKGSFESSLIAENVAGSDGGGLLLSGSSPAMAGNRILFNAAGESGGGVYMFHIGSTFQWNTLHGNVAVDGGGMALESADPESIHNIVTYNTASGKGGGIYVLYQSPTLRRNTISGNTAATLGGGVALVQSAALMVGNTLSSNAADAGGGISIEVDMPQVLQNAVVSNHAEVGGGVYVGDGSGGTRVEGNVIAYNSGYNLYLDPASSGTPVVVYNDLYASTSQNHNLGGLDGSNLLTEPGFLAFSDNGVASDDDLHAGSGSPLIDQGNPALLDPDGTRSDIGLYGGEDADAFDRDRDGYPDWFWPGRIEDAPPGFVATAYDVDDRDPSRH